MCGIAGLLDEGAASSPDELAEAASRMAGTLRHRGPDSAAVWVDAEAGVALGHRRLAIVDLSPEGHQPMVSAGGRSSLPSTVRSTISVPSARELEDGPALPRAVRHRGPAGGGGTMGARRGAGANGRDVRFRALGPQSRTLHLVRDRLGKKPLYFGWVGQSLLFALGAEGLPCPPGVRARGRPRRARAAPAAQLRTGAVFDLSRTSSSCRRPAPVLASER